MESKKRARGGVFKYGDDNLGYSFKWINPNGSSELYRWQFRTKKKANDSNRLELEELLNEIDFEIRSGIFRPCERFPEQKIASFCRCHNCLVASPMANAHLAPRTLGELRDQYLKHEDDRSSGELKEIERSSYKNKLKLWSALKSEVFFVSEEEGATYKIDPITDYEISELTPENVQEWLRFFQSRKDKPPVRTHYLINMLSEIKLALKFGQFKRYWSRHALIDYKGTLLKSTKKEISKAKNRSSSKPFTIKERDRIIEHFRKNWISCKPEAYNGKERDRLEILYHYIVIGFNTGLRSPSEMTALEWSDISYSRREIKVQKSREGSSKIEEQIIRQYTKTVYHRIIPINDIVLSSLRALEKFRQDEQDWIFWNPRASKDNPLAVSNGWAPLTGEQRIRRAFTKCLKELKILRDENSQYAMRHTFATLILDNTNFTDSKVAALIGDKVETMKQHYAGFCSNRWRGDDDLEQLNKMNSISSSRDLKSVSN